MSDRNEKYEAVIGLEVHAQLSTESKIYNPDGYAYGNEPNRHAGAITLAHPGTMPLLNKKVVEYAIKMGLACNSEISRYQIFDRKNYFYPDLPKGYQLTQDRTPICVGGNVPIRLKNGNERGVELTKIHIEEDAGKSIHLDGSKDTLLDFNRSGVPLIEIVTEPVMSSSEEAGALMTEVRRLVRYLNICDGNMEEGSLRCDANVSIRLKGETELGKKVEIKNMNSIRNVQKAIDIDIARQIELMERKEEIVSETRLFDADTMTTRSMRMKEELNDYRYFPDPDLSPLQVSEDWLKQINDDMPILPWQYFEKFTKEYKLPAYDALMLIENREEAAFLYELCKNVKKAKSASNWMMGPVREYLNEYGLEIEKANISVNRLTDLITLTDDGKISFSSVSSKLFHELMSKNKSVQELAQQLNLIQESNNDVIATLVDEVIQDFPDKVEEYKASKKGKSLLAMFMGEIMKRSRGKADPKLASELLRSKLS